MTTITNRTPYDTAVDPNLRHLATEQAVIGAVIHAGSWWSKPDCRDAASAALAMLQPHDFYHYAHQVIWRAVLEVIAAGNPPDFVYLLDRLYQNETIYDAGDSYIVECVNAFWTETFFVTNLARIVRSDGLYRRLADAAQRGDTSGIAEANQGLAALGAVNNADDFPTMREAVDSYFEMMGDDSTRVVRSGFGNLDRVLGGFRPGNLIVPAARPGVGKSAFGLTIAHHAAIRNDIPVGFLSLEMSSHEIIQRLIAMESGISTQEARQVGVATMEAQGRIADKPLYIRRPGSSVADVLAVAGPLVTGQGCQLIIIDYLQLMSAGGRGDSRPQEIATITREVKNFAQSSEVAIMLLSQLKRDPNHKGPPRLEDIADADAPARDADVVLFLHPGDDDDATATQPVELLIAKHRNGPTGSVRLSFVKKTTRFVETDFDANNW